MDISQAWGYGAVVLPKKLEYQGFVILSPSDPRVHEGIGRALASSAQIEGETTPSEGTLAAAVVQCLTQGHELGVAIFASALSEVIGHRFWVIDAYEDEGGVRTSVSRLPVTSAEAARDSINTRTLPLQMGLALREMESREPGKKTNRDDEGGGER